MKKTSGIIINDNIFLNIDHIVKIKKYDVRENAGFWIEIFLKNNDQTTLTYDNKEDRDNTFEKIISYICGNDRCIIFNHNN